MEGVACPEKQGKGAARAGVNAKAGQNSERPGRGKARERRDRFTDLTVKENLQGDCAESGRPWHLFLGRSASGRRTVFKGSQSEGMGGFSRISHQDSLGRRFFDSQGISMNQDLPSFFGQAERIKLPTSEF